MLAVYGSLAPGEANEHVLADLAGQWQPATIRGHRFTTTWLVGAPYPGFIADPSAEPMPVQLIASPELPDHWDRLDAFEGPGYNRRVVEAQTDDGPVEVSVYEVVLSAENCVAFYGSLRPGGAQHHTVSHLLGTGEDPSSWFDAAVSGYAYEVTWGPAEGFDGLSLHEEGHLVPVSVLFSAGLDRCWDRLDTTAGEGFTRRPTTLWAADGSRSLGQVAIYEALPDADDDC